MKPTDVLKDNVRCMFVYGTLRDDIGTRQHMIPDQAGPIVDAVIPGELYDMGAYPGAIPGTRVIHGRLIDMSPLTDAQWDAVLRRWDDVENHPKLFRRTRVIASVRGSPIPAWTYFYTNEIDDSRLIESGDWQEATG